jgi:hypothetical protein
MSCWTLSVFSPCDSLFSGSTLSASSLYSGVVRAWSLVSNFCCASPCDGSVPTARVGCGDSSTSLIHFSPAWVLSLMASGVTSPMPG